MPPILAASGSSPRSAKACTVRVSTPRIAAACEVLILSGFKLALLMALHLSSEAAIASLAIEGGRLFAGEDGGRSLAT